MANIDPTGKVSAGPANPGNGTVTDHGQELFSKPVDISLRGESFTREQPSTQSHQRVELAANSDLLSGEPCTRMKMISGYSPVFFGPYYNVDFLQEAPGLFAFAMQSRAGEWLPFHCGGQSGDSMIDRLEIEAVRMNARHGLRLGEDYAVFVRYHCPELGHFCTSRNVEAEVTQLCQNAFTPQSLIRGL